MKRFFALVLSFILALSLVACATTPKDAPEEAPTPTTDDSPQEQAPEADEESISIAISLSSFDNATNAFTLTRMKQYNLEHPELKLSYLDAANDGATQITQIEQAVLNGAQAVICLPVDAKQTQPIVTACNEAKVPLIALNRVFEGCDTFIGADNAMAGQLVAERCGKLLNGKGNIALIQGTLGQANTYERTDAIVATLEEKFPDIKIVLDGSAEWKREKALTLMETWLQSGTEFDAVIVLNDDAALGAQMALADAGLADEVPVLSINGEPSGINGVNDGLLDCTAFQAPFFKADKALELALEYIGGGTPPEIYLIKYELVTADNVADYMQFTSVK